MSETLFKKLSIYLGLSILICLILLTISVIYNSELLIFPSVMFFCIAFGSEITILSVYNTDNKKFRIIIYSLIPVCFILPFILNYITGWIILPIISGVIAVLLIGVALFIFNRKRTTLFFYILISLILVGLVMKRFHIPFAGVVLSIGLMGFSSGIFMYGIMSLLPEKKNKYLSFIIPLCSFILAVFSVGILFKIQHWVGGGFLLQFGLVSMILVTIIMLLSLPQSGFFNWNPGHRKLFYRNTVVPWLIAAFVIGYSFLMPPRIKEIIFPPRERIHFNMSQYELNQADTEDNNNEK